MDEISTPRVLLLEFFPRDGHIETRRRIHNMRQELAPSLPSFPETAPKGRYQNLKIAEKRYGPRSAMQVSPSLCVVFAGYEFDTAGEQ